MADAKLTPAPWRLGPGHDGMDAILGADNTWVCRIYVGDGDSADSALICAAPELLEALKIARAICLDAFKDTSMDWDDEAMNAIDAAISKAESANHA